VRRSVFLIQIYAGLTLSGLLAAADKQPAPWDPGEALGKYVESESGTKIKITAENRWRYESRTGVSFGKETDRSTVLERARFGMSYTPVSWLKIGGMVQDARAPLYGPGATTSFRDAADLQEAYLELFPDRKTGFGLTAGRSPVNYGDGRLLGTSQWGNLGRAWDEARAYYRTSRGTFEVLAVSPVKVRAFEFNRPVWGDRVWGTYNSFPNLFRRDTVDIYALRHDQNRPGGFTGGSRTAGTDRLRVNTFGFRMAGPLGRAWKYSLENAWQTGSVGGARHRAAAWFSSVTRRWMISRKTLDVTGEYKYASGSDNPSDLTRSGTFDQLYPSNHDKFGHQDMLGWRNLHNASSKATYAFTRNFAANVMYSSFWLASLRDSIYNGSGKAISRSATGTAGRHIGEELDSFVTYKYRHFLIGAGYGYFFKGEFINHTTPGVSPSYVYLFHTYTF
jgi:hypothetical protein